MNRVKNCGIEHPQPLYPYSESLKIRERLHTYLDGKIEEWNATVPFAKHFEDGSLNLPYYKRHTIEHVWRIRLSRTGQCRLLHAIAKKSPEAAQLYARYQDEEMLHDTLYARDLNAMGVSNEEILATEPFLSTRLLEGLFYFIAEHENPIGVICFGYLVEYTTKKLTQKQLDGLKKNLDESLLKGQISHLNTDIVEDHSGAMWDIMRHLIFQEEDVTAMFKYMDEIQFLLAMYFRELYEATVTPSQRKSA